VYNLCADRICRVTVMMVHVYNNSRLCKVQGYQRKIPWFEIHIFVDVLYLTAYSANKAWSMLFVKGHLQKFSY
jgi:hypothetical protein